MQAVYVLLLRDLKRFIRTKSRVFGSLGMPFFFLLFFSMGFRRASIPSLPENISYIEFLTPGIISMVLLFTGTFSGVSIVWDRQFGFLREILVAPISRMSIAVGRTLGGAITALIQGIIMLIASTLIGFRFNLTMLPIAILIMLLIAIAFTATGVAISTFMEDIHGFQIVVNFFVFPTFLLSGAIFPINEFPEFVKCLALLNPLTYGVDLLRFVFIGYSEINPLSDLLVLVLYSFIILLLSSILFSRTEVK